MATGGVGVPAPGTTRANHALGWCFASTSAYTRNRSVVPSPSRSPSAVVTHPSPGGTPSTAPVGQASPLSNSCENGEGLALGLEEADAAVDVGATCPSSPLQPARTSRSVSALAMAMARRTAALTPTGPGAPGAPG